MPTSVAAPPAAPRPTVPPHPILHERRSPSAVPTPPGVPLLAALAIGTALGVVFVQSEVASWFRIQEMFRFQSIHLYGIIGSAVATAIATTAALRRLGVRRRDGSALRDAPKVWGASHGARYWIGGGLFGLGWGLLGACPGPVYALIGGGATVFVVALAAALLGARLYASLRPHLPH